MKLICIIYSGFGLVMGWVNFHASENGLGTIRALGLKSSLIQFSVLYVSLQHIFKKSNPTHLSCWLKIISSNFLLSSSVMGIKDDGIPLDVLFVWLISIPGVLSPAMSVEVKVSAKSLMTNSTVL